MPKTYYFISIPKTGTNTVRNWLNAYQDRFLNCTFNKIDRMHHFAIANAERQGKLPSYAGSSRFFPSFFEDNRYQSADYAFTVVRNPFDLLASYYFHFTRSPKKNWTDNGWADCNSFHKFKNFEQFIDFYTHCEPEEWHVPELNKNLFGQAYSDEKSFVDIVLTNEHLNAGVLHLLSQEPSQFLVSPVNTARFFKRFFKERKKNITPNKTKNWYEYYNSKMIKSVEAKLGSQLEKFGYGFQSGPRQPVFHLS